MVPQRKSKGEVMKTLIIILTAVMTCLGGYSTAMAADGRSLAHVAATVADALAADDAAILQKYWITYEEAAAVSPRKVGTRSDFIQAKAEWKKQTDDTWREIREAKLLVDHVKIEEVRINKIKDVPPDRYRIVAVAVPVFRHRGELRPVPMMAMYFVQVDGQWKYASR
jgi:hypothetical protein